MTHRKCSTASAAAGCWLLRGAVMVLTLVSLLAPRPTLGAPAADAPPPQSTEASKKALPDTVATVNNEVVTKQLLAQECIRHYGQETLESMINKELIQQECKRRGISITSADVDSEIERMAKRFGLPVDQWFKMLRQERGIKPDQYARDIIWPMLALRRLAGERIQVTAEEVLQEYEKVYGAAVRARIIVSASPQEAEKVRRIAVTEPENFGNLAKDHSKDPNSASAKGLIPPIHRYMGDPDVEQAAFNMADGDISPVLRVGEQYLLLKREGLQPPANVTVEQARPRLEEFIRDRKLRGVASDIHRQLQKSAQVQVFLNGQAAPPQPGIVAVLNGQGITERELAEECLDRHAEDVLEGTINRRLIEQACRKAQITISEQEIDEEIARAAAESLPPKADGAPNVEAWLARMTQKQNISVDVYRRDSVWPSVALRKLVADQMVITEEDLQRGFEANYGPRVRCRAIVLGDLRTAQKVWEKFRNNPTVKFFGELASQYSIEAGSRQLDGEVPPIRKYGGQPLLEKEAFTLKPGEVSSIIQAGDKFIILLCEGYTDPIKVEPAAVRDMLREDITAKKLRVAMAEKFDALQEAATIDNFVAGTSRSPQPKQPAEANRLPAGAPVRERK